MKKRGRPPFADPSKRKTKNLVIRLTEAEQTLIREAAGDVANFNLSAWVRRHLLEYAEAVVSVRAGGGRS